MSLNITGLKVQSSNVVVEKCTRRGFSLLLLEKWTLKRISCIGFSGFPCEEQCLIGRGCLFSPSPPSFHSWSQLSTYCDFFRPFPVVSGSMWVLNAAQKGSHLGFVGHDEGITASLYTSLSHTSFIPPAKVFFFFYSNWSATHPEIISVSFAWWFYLQRCKWLTWGEWKVSTTF